MSDKIKTPEDLLVANSSVNRSTDNSPLKRGVIPRMFGHGGTFRDTGARLKHFENVRGPESRTTEMEVAGL